MSFADDDTSAQFDNLAAGGDDASAQRAIDDHDVVPPLEFLAEERDDGQESDEDADDSADSDTDDEEDMAAVAARIAAAKEPGASRTKEHILANYVKEKACLRLHHKLDIGFKPSRSPTWDTIMDYTIIHPNRLKRLDPGMFATLTEKKGHVFICTLCLADVRKPLKECYRTGEGGKVTNPAKHLKFDHGQTTIHEEAAERNDQPASAKRKRLNTPSPSQRTVDVGATSRGSTPASAASRGSTEASSRSRSKSRIPANPIMAKHLNSAKAEGKKEVLKKFHDHIVNWSTLNNISQRSITRSHAFTEMIDYVIEKAPTLSRCPPMERKLGDMKFNNCRKSQFEEMIACIANDIKEARQCFHQLCGRHIPFVTVSQGCVGLQEEGFTGSCRPLLQHPE